MIKIKNLTKKCDVLFVATEFPDGTQQVWKMNPAPEKNDNVKVIWQFEGEREYITAIQIGVLVAQLTGVYPNLYVPYLPYARQDKKVSNENTFAKKPMIDVLGSFYGTISSFDVHSSDYGDLIESRSPETFFSFIPKHDVICFPDAGAKKRYAQHFNTKRVITFTKKRDSKTGEINLVKLLNPSNISLKNKSILMVDDICDGGSTFVKCAEVIHKHKPKIVNLAVSHGIFSKGFGPLNEAKIEQVYSTNSLAKNNIPGFFNILDL